MRAAHVRDVDQALAQRTISADEAAKLKSAADAVAAAIAVDDFAPEELTARGAVHKGDVSSPATSREALPSTTDRLPPEQAPSLPQPEAPSEAAE
jgi:acyl-CoA dehydrogenase